MNEENVLYASVIMLFSSLLFLAESIATIGDILWASGKKLK